MKMKPRSKKRTEESMQIALSTYIKLKYPSVVFTAESSGVRVSIGQAVKMKKQRSVGCLPDMIILEPRAQYCGLVMELKSADNSPFLKNGSLSKDQHIQEQNAMLLTLKSKGYMAVFAVGVDRGIAIIDSYMSLPDGTR